jgi:hypothetical protein
LVIKGKEWGKMGDQIKRKERRWDRRERNGRKWRKKERKRWKRRWQKDRESVSEVAEQYSACSPLYANIQTDLWWEWLDTQSYLYQPLQREGGVGFGGEGGPGRELVEGVGWGGGKGGEEGRGGGVVGQGGGKRRWSQSMQSGAEWVTCVSTSFWPSFPSTLT